ncbi:MAG: hypothetical protein K8I30_14160, partial [Anaerolineae bacterium]|nr:hypothetical protein [Anaerolineae bacterium]
MFRNVLKKVVGDPVERALARYREAVDKINALEPDMKKLTDDQLRAKTDELKKRLADGAELDSLLVEAYAAVR